MTDLTDRVENIVHEPTQARDGELDLTVAEVYEIAEPGRIDFGGGELTDAELNPHERTWRNEADDYQWWTLNAGQFLVEFNESLATDELLVVQPRQELLARGASHPTLRTTGLGRVPLSVGGAGLRLKENARITTVVAPE